MRVIKAPSFVRLEPWEVTVFLAGSIEMGTAEDWQSRVEREFSDIEELVLLNPRRDDWDSSWEQSLANPQFMEQVMWELESLERADKILMYFSPGTKSPITLLELGLFVGRDIYVCCPEGFWRKGNVDIVCHVYHRHVSGSLDATLEKLREDLQ